MPTEPTSSPSTSPSTPSGTIKALGSALSEAVEEEFESVFEDVIGKVQDANSATVENLLREEAQKVGLTLVQQPSSASPFLISSENSINIFTFEKNVSCAGDPILSSFLT